MDANPTSRLYAEPVLVADPIVASAIKFRSNRLYGLSSSVRSTGLSGSNLLFGDLLQFIDAKLRSVKHACNGCDFGIAEIRVQEQIAQDLPPTNASCIDIERRPSRKISFS